MKLSVRISAVVISALITIGWPLMPSQLDGQGPSCAKPEGASCGSKTITVYADGLHDSDAETLVCRGDTVDWQVENSVASFTIHMDESPFDPNFGPGDFCAGDNCSGHEKGTDKLTAHTKDSTPNYLRCHKYTITVAPKHGSKVTIDPHIIVAAE